MPISDYNAALMSLDGNQPPTMDHDAGTSKSIAMQQPAAGEGDQPTSQAPAVIQPISKQAQDALHSLLRAYELESDYVRWHKVRLYRKTEEFWRCNQNATVGANMGNWYTPFMTPPEDQANAGRFDYNENYYRAWGLSIVASLSQASPKIEYLPVSAESQDDVATAKSATKIAELISRNNDMTTLRVKKAYTLWNQGIYAAYTRFLVDGGQFGYHDEDQYEMQQVQMFPDRFECPNCGHMQPAAQSPSLLQGSPVGCQNCGAIMGPESFYPAEYANVPTASGAIKVPNGAEKIDVYGPLFFKVPPQAENQRNCYYLILVGEYHKATLRAAYPDKASQIDDVGSGASDTYERIVRLSLADAQGQWNTMPMANLITYKRGWLRPEAFWAHANEQEREELLRAFPDGCRVEFAGDVFLQAVPESMDDHWSICTGLPGIGMYRDPLGLDALSIQEQINDTANILAEHRELAGAPPVLYDSRYINGDALKKKRMQPASYTPILMENVGVQKPLSDMIFQPELHVDPQLWTDNDRMAQTGQFITGALPSIFGGGSPNLKTAAAYSQARDQAMGRLSLIWKEMRSAEAREMTQAIECFRRNRTEDVELVVQGRGADFRSEFVRLSDIKGNVVATPTADEDFPQTFSQVQQSINMLLQSKDQAILTVLGAPVNRPLMQHYMGLSGFVDPGDANRSKQYLEIDGLLKGAPTPAADGSMLPTIMPEPLVDDHLIHIEAIKDWAVSDTGISNKSQNPDGYANVIAHLVAHMDAAEASERDETARQVSVQGAGQPGAPPAPPPGAPEPPGPPPAPTPPQ